MPAVLTADILADALTPGAEIYAPGCAGHSSVFEAWLRSFPERSAGVRYTGIHIPTVNRFDFSGLHPQARMRNIFLGQDWLHSWRAGQFDYLPISYSAAWQWLAQEATFDLALLQVAPPDADGRCSLGLACDFTPAAWPRAKRVFAHVNPALPMTDGPFIPWTRIDAAVEQDAPLLQAPDPPADESLDAVAKCVAEMVPDHATLQLGLGRLQSAVLRQLSGRRGLKIHSGMVSDGLVSLLQSGALAEGPGTITAGVALGTPALYDQVAAHVAFREVAHTHDNGVLRQLDRLHAINSALSVDLLGQVNGDCIGARLVSGLGGLPDFLRGARQSRGGRGIIALPATTASGKTRIVPMLDGMPVSLPRIDADCIVTEHGCVDLRYLDTHQRARALISIAAPEHRDELERAWNEMAARL